MEYKHSEDGGRSFSRRSALPFNTMGQIFQDAGYATGMFGKPHLGNNDPFRPEDRGFGEVMRRGRGVLCLPAEAIAMTICLA